MMHHGVCNYPKTTVFTFIQLLDIAITGEFAIKDAMKKT